MQQTIYIFHQYVFTSKMCWNFIQTNKQTHIKYNLIIITSQGVNREGEGGGTSRILFSGVWDEADVQANQQTKTKTTTTTTKQKQKTLRVNIQITYNRPHILYEQTNIPDSQFRHPW